MWTDAFFEIEVWIVCKEGKEVFSRKGKIREEILSPGLPVLRQALVDLPLFRYLRLAVKLPASCVPIFLISIVTSSVQHRIPS